MLSPKALIQLHIETLFDLDSERQLLTVRGKDDPAPRFFLGSTHDGNAIWFRQGLGVGVRDDLTALVATTPIGLEGRESPEFAIPFSTRLEEDEPVQKTWTGPAFCCPADLPFDNDTVRVTAENATVLTPYLEDWAEDVQDGIPLTVVLDDGKAVSVCCSVAVTDRAHEAGVETHPDFRGRGLAAKAVAAWAHAVRELDRIPLYSTSWENVASRSVAAKLGLFQYGTTLHIT